MEKRLNIVLILAYILSLIAIFIIFRPFLATLILGMIFVMFMFPINKRLKKYVPNDIIRSTLMTILTLVILIIPLSFITITVTDEARSVYTAASNLDLTEINQYVESTTGWTIDLESQIIPIIGDIRDFLRSSVTNIVTLASVLFIKLFVLLFVLYYGFKEGEKLVKKIADFLPFKKSHTKELIESIKNVIFAVLYGQFLVAVIQGVVGGLAFWIFGLPNPIFWGMIMAVLSFIPLLGPPLIWGPAAIMLFYQGQIVQSIGLLLVGSVIIMNIDNVLKPKIIGDRLGLHPLIILLGILGGIMAFGIIGFILGPILLALSLILIKFFNEEHLTV
jgi:predicted PurR-regulated permease PerM